MTTSTTYAIPTAIPTLRLAATQTISDTASTSSEEAVGTVVPKNASMLHGKLVVWQVLSKGEFLLHEVILRGNY